LIWRASALPIDANRQVLAGGDHRLAPNKPEFVANLIGQLLE
jgi:hypothetical protein